MQPLGVLLPKRGLQAGQRHGGQLAHCLNAQLGFDLPAGQEGKLEGRLTREGNTAGWLAGWRGSAVQQCTRMQSHVQAPAPLHPTHLLPKLPSQPLEAGDGQWAQQGRNR